MYQTYDDMVEDEYLRKRIRNILGEQVKARGYGNSWNSELGARNYPNDKNEGGVMVGGVMVGGKDDLSSSLDDDLDNLYSGGYGKKSKWTECVSKHRGAKNASKFYDKKNKICSGSQTSTIKSRRTTTWNKFRSDNKGKGYSMKQLSEMYKSGGGVLIQSKSARKYNNTPTEGGEYMGGIYLR
jgi:hypothetical protein